MSGYLFLRSGGLGPNVHSDEYKEILRRKKMMLFFANNIKKINDKRMRKGSLTRNQNNLIFTKNGQLLLGR